jgi:hypothetical protein
MPLVNAKASASAIAAMSSALTRRRPAQKSCVPSERRFPSSADVFGCVDVEMG